MCRSYPLQLRRELIPSTRKNGAAVDDHKRLTLRFLSKKPFAKLTHNTTARIVVGKHYEHVAAARRQLDKRIHGHWPHTVDVAILLAEGLCVGGSPIVDAQGHAQLRLQPPMEIRRNSCTRMQFYNRRGELRLLDLQRFFVNTFAHVPQASKPHAMFDLGLRHGSALYLAKSA